MGQILIPGGGGGTGVYSVDLTATKGDVLKGKSYVGSDTGDEAGIGTLELTGNAGIGDVLAGKGFYATDPKTKLTGALALTGNITAQRVLSGYTGYATDPKIKITGVIPSYSGRTITPGTSNQTIAAGNYLSGNVVIAGDGDLVAGNIRNGVNIFGVTGNVQRWRYTQVNLTASTSRRKFEGLNSDDPDGNYYYIDYAPGFTPQMYILHADMSDKMPMESFKTIWGLAVGRRNTSAGQSGYLYYYKSASETAQHLILPAGGESGGSCTLRVWGYD